MSNNNYLTDKFELTLTPVLRYKPAFALRTGIFTGLDRLSRSSSKIIISSQRNQEFINRYLKSIEFNHEIIFSAVTHDEAAANSITPASLIQNIGNALANDLGLLDRENFTHTQECLINGNPEDLYIHASANISKFAEIDTTNGPVIIDSKADISSFSILRGPLYIGKNCILDKLMISNSITGRDCRLGGEISDSIIGDYTNKHHEGFLGHSIVGDWVNLGALTTTSDLKNNYGIIHLEYENSKFNTNIIKFGSIIGDYVKTGIGTMLNTGTIIDTGSLLFQDHPRLKYYSPFFWGGSQPAKYEFTRFLSDMEKIMARRQVAPSDFFKKESGIIFNNGK